MRGAQSLAMLLRMLGQDVRTAPDGPSALEAARVAAMLGPMSISPERWGVKTIAFSNSGG
jgi:hypothetical protein